MRSAVFAFAGCATLLAPRLGHAEAGGSKHGAIVVALGEGAGPAAKPLAREIYRDEALRASIDDATARVLAGDPPAEGAPQSLKDLAQVRASIPASPEDAAGRRLLASLGEEQRAEIVVAVSVAGDRTIARVLRVGSAKYEPLELGPTIERTESGEAKFSWPGAQVTLHKLVVKDAPGPIAPVKTAAPPVATPKEEKRAWYKSPWFWGPVGAVVAVGAAVLIASKATEDDHSMVRLTGQVAP